MYASLLTNVTNDMNPDSDGNDDTPKTMEEALASLHAEEWKKAIMLELDEKSSAIKSGASSATEREECRWY